MSVALASATLVLRELRLHNRVRTFVIRRVARQVRDNHRLAVLAAGVRRANLTCRRDLGNGRIPCNSSADTGLACARIVPVCGIDTSDDQTGADANEAAHFGGGAVL